MARDYYNIRFHAEGFYCRCEDHYPIYAISGAETKGILWEIYLLNRVFSKSSWCVNIAYAIVVLKSIIYRFNLLSGIYCPLFIRTFSTLIPR
jgi:hypothetical protein